MDRENRRNVKSETVATIVDGHERERNFITKAELEAILKATKSSRYRWRDTAMFLLMFHHGLRVSELCELRRKNIDLLQPSCVN